MLSREVRIMSLLLNIPYNDRKNINKLGAKWMPKYNKWLVQKRLDYPKFIKWILRNENYTSIICNCLYIAESNYKCPNCNKQTTVISFCIKSIFEIIDYFETKNYPYKFKNFDIGFSSFLDPMPIQLKNFIEKNFSSYCRLSNTEYGDFGNNVILNKCVHCNKQFSDDPIDYTVFDYPPNIIEKVYKYKPKLKLYKFKLNYDLIADVDLYPTELSIHTDCKIIDTGIEI